MAQLFALDQGIKHGICRHVLCSGQQRHALTQIVREKHASTGSDGRRHSDAA